MNIAIVISSGLFVTSGGGKFLVLHLPPPPPPPQSGCVSFWDKPGHSQGTMISRWGTLW